MAAIDSPTPVQSKTLRHAANPAAAASLWFVAGLALSRLLYEWHFPSWAWVGEPLPAVAMAAGLAALGGVLAWRFRLSVAAFLPLLLNLFWLMDPAVAPARGRFLFGASLWLAVVLLVWTKTGDRDRRWRWLGPLLVTTGLLPVYLLTMSSAVGAADTFEFQVVAPHLGIAHPTGYPLYLLLGKLFSLLPSGTVAWRLNLASAVYATAAAVVIFRLGLRLLGRPLAALAGATVLGLVPIFWSQAIVAEVYTLHALIVASALMLMLRLVDNRVTGDLAGSATPARAPSSIAENHKTMTALAFVIGLGLTNHLTTVFLLPPAAVAVAFSLYAEMHGGRRSTVSRRRSLALLALQLAIAFTLPLLIYAYLPLRWSAIHHEPMGFGRFIDWVIGGRFQGALQWGAWLRDSSRRAIVGRLLLDAWGWFYLAVAAGGLIWLIARRGRAALVLAITAAGFTFYALNYYVPDLAVFLIPTHVVIAVWVAAGLAALLGIPFSGQKRLPDALSSLLFLAVMTPSLLAAGNHWPAVDQSSRDGGEPWAREVLARPLARGAAVLADSEKIAPLYYLQQIEGLRRDLTIMVLPDEAAYRAELAARLAGGQAVYLARYLPGLEGSYHLRSEGPLVEVSREPLTALPTDAEAAGLRFGALRLAGFRPDSGPAGAPAVTLFWALDAPLASGETAPTLYSRWNDPSRGIQTAIAGGLHPVGNNYPVNAMRPGEIVPDYHALPVPIFPCDNPDGCLLEFQVAVAPRFSASDELVWQTVATIPVLPQPGPVGVAQRAYFDGFALDGIDASAPPSGATMPIRFSGFGEAGALHFLLVPPHAVSSFVFPASGAPAHSAVAGSSTIFQTEVEFTAIDEPLSLVALPTGEQRAVCGWLAIPTTGCVVANVTASGVALPEGAVNFDGQLALLDIEMDQSAVAPGDQLPVTITWQGLAKMDADYTVFVQVLDAADKIVGQVDAWPVQGTFPTSQWQPGEIVVDPYLVTLSPDMEPGPYRLHAGLYLLATGQRLPVIDTSGNPIDDKVEVAVIFD